MFSPATVYFPFAVQCRSGCRVTATLVAALQGNEAMSDLRVTTATSGIADEASLSSGADQGQLLVIVVDVNPNQALFCRQSKVLFHWLDCILGMANAHVMMQPTNSVAMIASHSQSCSFLYPPIEDGESTEARTDGHFDGFSSLSSTVRERVAKILATETEPTAPLNPDSLLSGAMCMALAYINRRRQELPVGQATFAARVLVSSASGDTASQYMNYMNVFFSAQKMGVIIDTCMIERDSGLLQQGADITSGIYMKIRLKNLPSLLQFLIWIFLPDARLRKTMSLPPAEKVDYRAACFCHRELIDIGFVCSVCLSIFCKFSPICTTCGSVFHVFKGAGPLPMAKKKKTVNSESQ